MRALLVAALLAAMPAAARSEQATATICRALDQSMARAIVDERNRLEASRALEGAVERLAAAGPFQGDGGAPLRELRDALRASNAAVERSTRAMEDLQIAMRLCARAP